MTTNLTLCDCVLHLIHLDLTEPLDLGQVSPRCCMHARDGIVAVRFQLRDVNCADTMRLDGVDVDDEAFLSRIQLSVSYFTFPIQRWTRELFRKAQRLTSLAESSLATEDGDIAIE